MVDFLKKKEVMYSNWFEVRFVINKKGLPLGQVICFIEKEKQWIIGKTKSV
jgi:hypothetical protein